MLTLIYSPSIFKITKYTRQCSSDDTQWRWCSDNSFKELQVFKQKEKKTCNSLKLSKNYKFWNWNSYVIMEAWSWKAHRIIEKKDLSSDSTTKTIAKVLMMVFVATSMIVSRLRYLKAPKPLVLSACWKTTQNK